MDWIPARKRQSWQLQQQQKQLQNQQQNQLQNQHRPQRQLQHQYPNTSPLRLASTSTSTSTAASRLSLPLPNQKIGRFHGRDSLSPGDAIFASAHELAQYQLQQHLIKQNALTAMRVGELPPPPRPVAPSHILHPRRLGGGRHSHSHSEPTRPLLPLVAYAGNRSSNPSLPVSQASVPPLPDLDDSTTSLIVRMTSAPPSIPSAPPTAAKARFFSSSKPVIDWRRLPNEAFECVLIQLRRLHLSRSSKSCSTCYMRDLVALQLTSCSWVSLPQKALYTHIAIHGSDSNTNAKKAKIRALHGGRLHLLRRTLRSKPHLGALVTTLHVPDPIIPLYLPNGDPNPQYDDYICLLASLVMACPNLQSFTGFHSFYNHTFDRLTHALSTRRQLRQHVWIIAENIDVAMRAQTQLPPGLLDPEQTFLFSLYHDRWSQLETLMLCAPGSLGVLEHELLVDVLHSLPKLKNLCVSSLDADDFANRTLLSLPPLTSLRLEECTGITDAGLSKWAASPAAVTIERLCLVHQNITSLVTIAKVLSGLERLTKLSIVQTDVEPTLPLEMVEEGIVLQPLFASRTLRWLHWDIACDYSPPLSIEQSRPSWRNSMASGILFPTPPQGIAQRPTHFKGLPLPPSLDQLQALRSERMSANTHLALSVLHSGFPSLKRLRAPRDTSPPGVLQSVCLPATNANVLLPQDRFALHLLDSTTGVKASGDGAGVSNSLQMARIRAQRTIDAVASTWGESVKVVVTDHSDPEPRTERKDTEGDCSTSSGSWFSSGTEITEPDIDDQVQHMLSPVQDISGSGQDWGKEVLISSRLSQLIDHRVENVQTHRKTCSSCGCQVFSTAQEDQTWNRVCKCESSTSSRFAHRSKRPTSTMIAPLKVHEFSLPSFVGRVSLTLSQHGPCHPPIFHLMPDIPGRDGNGGIAGWGELLRVGEREKVVHRNFKNGRDGSNDDEEENDSESDGFESGCTGAWNEARVRKAEPTGFKKKTRVAMLGKRKAAEWWRHTPRPMARDAWTVDVDDFF